MANNTAVTYNPMDYEVYSIIDTENSKNYSAFIDRKMINKHGLKTPDIDRTRIEKPCLINYNLFDNKDEHSIRKILDFINNQNNNSDRNLFLSNIKNLTE